MSPRADVRSARRARAALLGAALVAAVAGAAGTRLVRRARADGIPAAGALVYSGQLTKAGGEIVDSPRNIGLEIHAAATGENAVCRVPSASVPVAGGRFQIPLPEDCTRAVQANPNLWIEVQVDGGPLGRAKIGAVPYAVEAGRASALVDALARRLVPAGAVMHFDLPQCPPGWSDYVPARGRYLVGLTEGGAPGEVVGQPLEDHEDRAVGRHAHPVNDPKHAHSDTTAGAGTSGAAFSGRDPQEDERANCYRVLLASSLDCGDSWNGHSHTISAGPTNVTVGSYGDVPGTNAPYVQIRACRKD